MYRKPRPHTAWRIARYPYILSILLLIASPLSAQNAGRCGEPDVRSRGRNFLVIDANSALPLEGRSQFYVGDRVQVIIRNKNPYRYAYRIGSSTSPLPGLILSEMLTPLLVDFSGSQSPGRSPLKLSPDCTGEVGQRGVQRIGSIEALTRGIDDDLESLRKKIEGYARSHDEFLKTITSEKLYCEKTLSDGKKLLSTLDELINPNELVSGLERIGDKINRLDDLYNDLEHVLGGASDECRLQTASMRRTEEGRIRQNAAAILGMLGKIVARKQGFVDLATVISSVNESSFTDVIEPYAGNEPRTIGVEIYRRDMMVRNSPEMKMGEVKLEFLPKHLVSFSAGLGFSTNDEIAYTRQTALVPLLNGSGTRIGDTLATVIGTSRNSSALPRVIALINFHIYNWSAFTPNDMSIGASIGTVLSTGLFNDRAEYIAGVTLGAVDNYLLITLGLHWSRLPELTGGFNAGDRVPDGLGELPITEEYKTGFVFGVSGRIY